ncbi:type II secretion system protein [Candidatus Roizmanbacteria bacterium]|nr:type II secretion system protein [Candidatus Roizmanbacteria bacterium]
MKFQNKHAFTLVEILITIAVVGAAVGIGTASYVSFNERQVVEQAALTLRNNFRSIQQRALSGQKDIAICEEAGNPLPLAGWCFSPQENTDGDQDRYLLYGACGPKVADNEMQPFPETADEAEQVEMPDGVRITNFVNNANATIGGRILFVAGSNRVNISAVNPADPTTFLPFEEIVYCIEGDLPTLGVPGAENVYEIRVRDTGDIVDNGFVGACPSTPPL